VNRRQITGDFGYYEKIDKRVAIAAAKTVCLGANDTAEAILFLDMLGLLPPQPGNEKVARRRNGSIERPRASEEETMERLNVRPEEIGE
jgi:hypothetical protein